MGGLGSSLANTALNSPFPLLVHSLLLLLSVHYSSFCAFHPNKVLRPVQNETIPKLRDLSFAKQGLLVQGRCEAEFESFLET